MWLKLAIFRGFGHMWGVIDYVVIFLIFISRSGNDWSRHYEPTHPG
jgi:hypothetical protein